MSRYTRLPLSITDKRLYKRRRTKSRVLRLNVQKGTQTSYDVIGTLFKENKPIKSNKFSKRQHVNYSIVSKEVFVQFCFSVVMNGPYERLGNQGKESPCAKDLKETNLVLSPVGPISVSILKYRKTPSSYDQTLNLLAFYFIYYLSSVTRIY